MESCGFPLTWSRVYDWSQLCFFGADFMTASAMRKLKKRIRVSSFAVGVNMGSPVSGKDSKQEPITCTDINIGWERQLGFSCLQMWHYSYIPGSTPNAALSEAEADLCLVNSDIPQEKHNVCFPSCHVGLESHITHIFQHWAPLMSPTSGKCPEMTLRAAFGWVM